MACPHFVDGTLCRCTAVRGHVVPTLHQRERYCLTDGWGRCPTHRARGARAAALPEEAYWALWLAGGGGGDEEEAPSAAGGAADAPTV